MLAFEVRREALARPNRNAGHSYKRLPYDCRKGDDFLPACGSVELLTQQAVDHFPVDDRQHGVEFPD